MILQENKLIFNFGKTIGFIISYTIFTTILFFILSLYGNLLSFYNYLATMVLTAIISLFGYALKRFLE